MLGIDGSKIVDALEDRSFEVVPDSRSDYPWTHLALPSMLDMSLVTDESGAQPTGYRPRQFAYESESFSRLHGAGYEVVTVDMGWEEMSLRGGDRFFDPGQINDLERGYLQTIAIYPVIQAIAPWFDSEMQRQRVRAILEFVRAEAATPALRPRFIVGHLPIPHVPFVFGPEGQPRDPLIGLHHYFDHGESNEEARAAYFRDYADQLRYTDRLLLETVDSILASSSRPPVILVVSDHGSRSTYDLHFYASDGIDESSANLIALHAPGHPDLLPDSMWLRDVLGPILDVYVGPDPDRAP
jgi:hypothetical protein